jgi:hypothetical protein
MNNIEKMGLVSENVGVIVIEMIAPPVLDDIVEHVLHDLKKIFVKDFGKNQEPIQEIKSFIHDLEKNVSKDFHLIKSICCSHSRHANTLKQFVERSLIKNGFETAVTAGVVSIVGFETLPILAGAVIVEQITEKFEEKFEPKIKEKVLETINFFRKHEEINNNKKIM